MSARPPNELLIESDSPQHTEQIGATLGRLLRAGDLICLSGQLGAGKTVLSRGIGIGWGADPPLSSPTYNLVHEHGRENDGARLQHIDLYRIRGMADAASLGIDDILDSDDIAIIEWPERIDDHLPLEQLRIDIELADEQARELIMSARGERYLNLLDALRDVAFSRT